MIRHVYWQHDSLQQQHQQQQQQSAVADTSYSN
jgi:hypothetical protein